MRTTAATINQPVPPSTPERFPTRLWNVLWIIILCAALLVSGCQPIQMLELESATSATPRYGTRGPHAVGYQWFVAGEVDAPLEVYSWYPALNPDDSPAIVEYSVQLKDSTWAPTTPPLTQGHALQDAAVDDARGPYPLVIFSHGFTLSPAWYHTLAEQYASHGFIVLAPEHVEQFDPTFGDMWKTLIDRPGDVTQTLDYAEMLNAPDGAMAGLIDMENVAVVGHSYGGYTALAAAGARYDLAAYNARCAALAEDDPLAFFCFPIVPMEAEMAARAGFDPMPNGLWPSLGDPRVKAIIPMAGDSYLFDQAGLAHLSIPVMAITGGADTGTPVDWGAVPTYDYVASEHKTLVTLTGAEHMIFTTPCENQPWISEHPYADYFCADPAWDKTEALTLIHHFSTAFLLDTLKADAAAHAVLLPQAVQFSGIEYTTSLQ